MRRTLHQMQPMIGLDIADASFTTLPALEPRSTTKHGSMHSWSWVRLYSLSLLLQCSQKTVFPTHMCELPEAGETTLLRRRDGAHRLSTVEMSASMRVPAPPHTRRWGRSTIPLRPTWHHGTHRKQGEACGRLQQNLQQVED